MKKIISLFAALTFILSGLALADIQIDRGQERSASPKKFFVARFARTASTTSASNTQPGWISADSIVVWDSTSNDGRTVTTSTTSSDGLVAGIAMENILGSSRDNTAAEDESYGNFGRVQCWGRYNEARWNAAMSPGLGAAMSAGSRFSTSATAQNAGLYTEAYVATTGYTDDDSSLNTSRDYAGVTLEATTAGDTAIDVFVDRC